MFHYAYSKKDLEQKASELIRLYDPQRFFCPKPIDVYDVIDKILGVPYENVYLTPDQSILGMTAFDDIEWYCWPFPDCPNGLKSRFLANCLTDEDRSLLPKKRLFPKGTILIEKTLNTPGANIGRHNFTVMHEIFHQFLHKKEFIRIPPDFKLYSNEETFSPNGHKALKKHIEFIEFQAVKNKIQEARRKSQERRHSYGAIKIHVGKLST